MSRIQRPVPAGDFLERMAHGSRRRVEAARAGLAEARLAARVHNLPPPPALRLSPQGFDLIAEVKRRSPSVGALATEALSGSRQARRYVGGGACALSVLTEPGEFGGNLAHLKEVAAAIRPLPAMRKDFLVAPYQVMEARAAGAAGVLLIVAMLTDDELDLMLARTLELDLFALVEVFDERDLARAVRALDRLGPAIVDGRCRYLLGVNCRDLRELTVDFARFARLAPQLPRDIPAVAESGVDSASLASRVAELGYRVALVGTALMRASDPGLLAAELLEAGRASAPV